MNLQKIKYMLMACDMERAIKFYTDNLDLNVSVESPYWSELTFGDCIVALHAGHDGSVNKTGLSLQFSDVQAAYQKMIATGAKAVHEPIQREGEPIVLATVLDPEGNEIMLTQYVG